MLRLGAAIALVLMLACAQKPPKEASRPRPPAAAPGAVRVAPKSEFAFEILEHDTPPTMTADSVTVVLLKLKNTSSRDWPMNGPFKLGYAWSDDRGTELEKMGGRSLPQKDVPAGQMAYFKARVKAPPTPGVYYLVWDMVEEKVSWFSKKGATPVKVAVTVQ